MKHFKQWWWKITGILLLIYGFTFGMLIPLKPGIVTAEPFTATLGQPLQLNVQGYNTYYTTAADFRAWLKLDSFSIAASNIEVQSDQQISLTFNLPENLPSTIEERSPNLIIDNNVDGTHLLPSAVQTVRGPARGAGQLNAVRVCARMGMCCCSRVWTRVSG